MITIKVLALHRLNNKGVDIFSKILKEITINDCFVGGLDLVCITEDYGHVLDVLETVTLKIEVW